MDINLLRSVLSVAGFAVFLGIVGWAYAPRRKQRFDDDALSIFKDIEP